MDFGMPYSQKQAWNNVKYAIDNYAKVTGCEIAVVTKFNKASQLPAAGDGSVSNQSSMALHGHGGLLSQVKHYLEQIRHQFDNPSNGGDVVPSIGIPAPQRNANYHTQSIARSLTSSFQSLRLGGDPHAMRSSMPKNASQKKDKSTRRNPTAAPANKDLAELNENLLFEEESAEEEAGDSTDSEYDDDFDSDGYSDYRRENTNISSRFSNFQPDPSKSGTSLPVNISMNFMPKPEGPVFSQMKYPIGANRQQNLADDTPNPTMMMASIQALARSVTEDSAQIFGERPRPNVVTQKFT